MKTATAITREELTKRFCDRDAWRHKAMLAPMFENGFAYYTDARVCVWHASEPFENAEGKAPRLYPIRELLEQMPGEWEPLTLPPMECEKCKLTGRVMDDTCDQCDGKGKVDHDCDCEFCCHNNRVTCTECNGTGKASEQEEDCYACKQSTVELCGLFFSRHMIAKFADISGLESKSDNNKIALRFGECYALAMALRERGAA